MDELQIILPDESGNKLSQKSLIMVKLLFNPTTINKSLLSLQRQRRSSWSASMLKKRIEIIEELLR